MPYLVSRSSRTPHSDPPEDVRRYWSDDYPDTGTVESCRVLVRDCGYRLLGDFVLPESAWWEYYGPMSRRLESLASKYTGDTFAEAILRETAGEIATYRKYSEYFGYVFLVVAKEE
jgi:hypothetical protein